ncbi:hypothetical protein BDA99DRAFT_494823 [Phascolomyces articulosus]|uniref:Uncharacterized protein n=1 Tax=Phascolomyces articulosus TaxID=60185 RepID=A0AAD5PJY9_9FUNG|nr:hypothetical protein BDA99DRAFT_494823 [Phascolomyces articulosus]
MNTALMEAVVRRLGDLQEQKARLVDQYEYDIRHSPLVINEEGQTQITDRIVIIALSTDQMQPDDTQSGGYSIVPLDRNSPLLFGYHDGRNTGTLIFFLKAVRKILKTTPKDEPITIITRNHATANYLKGENNINESNPMFPLLVGCVNDIEDLFEERTAPVFGYWMEPDNNVDWMKDFSELARKVASEARKLRIITDDDRQMDAAHQTQNVASASTSRRPEPLAQVRSYPLTQEKPQKPVPSATQPSHASQHPQPTQSTQPSQAVQHPPHPQHPIPGPLTPIDEIVATIQKLAVTRNERIEFFKKNGTKMGMIGNHNIVLNNDHLPPIQKYHIAFISMSVDVRRPDGKQAGGYGIVWVGNNTTNQFGYYDNPYPGTVFFLLMAVRDVLAQCPRNESLMIATTNHAIVNFINDKKALKKNEHMDHCLEEIERAIDNRNAPTSSFLIGQYTQRVWVKDFYEMSRQVGSEARKLGLIRNFSPLPSDITTLIPLPPTLSSSSSNAQRSQQQQLGQTQTQTQTQRTQKTPTYNTKTIVENLRELEKRRIEYLHNGRKILRTSNGTINFDNAYYGRDCLPVPRMAFIAMSTDIPRQDNGHQAGGYSAIWLDKESDNQFGNHDNPSGGTLVFLLKAVQEALAECPPDRHLIIASTNKAVDNFIVNVHNKPSQPLHDVNTILAEIEEQLRTRTAPTESILLEKEYLQVAWIKNFYDLARKVASEARKLWFTYSDEEKVSLAPRIGRNASNANTHHKNRGARTKNAPPRVPHTAGSSASHARQIQYDQRLSQPPVPMQPQSVPEPSIHRPDELPHANDLSNQSNQQLFEGMHPSRAAALGLTDISPPSSSVAQSNGHHGLQADSEQDKTAPLKSPLKNLKIQPSVVVPSVPVTSLPMVTPVPVLPPPPQVLRPDMFQSRIPDNVQPPPQKNVYQDPMNQYQIPSSSTLPGSVTVPLVLSPQKNHQSNEQQQQQHVSNKRQLSQKEQSSQNSKKQKTQEKSEQNQNSVGRSSGWSNPVSKWVNKMFGR